MLDYQNGGPGPWGFPLQGTDHRSPKSGHFRVDETAVNAPEKSWERKTIRLPFGQGKHLFLRGDVMFAKKKFQAR